MSAIEPTIESLLRAHAPHAPERLRARVASLEPVPGRRFGLAPRRFALVALPAAVALAVVAALVNGALDSGSKPVTEQSAGASGAATTVADSAQLRASAPQAKLAPNTPSVTSSRLAHTDASLRLRVPDTDALSDATTRATQIATSLGGYAKSVDYATPRNGNGAAYVELRVPSQNVKQAIARLSSLGTIVSQELSVTDLQGKLETQSAQIAQLRRRIAALHKALANPALPEAQRVLLQIKLAESKRALAQRLHARKSTITAGANARISLVIGTEKAITPAPHRSRASRMLHSAVGFLALEGMIALYALIVVSPFALVGALVWFWRRRSVDRLLTAA